MTIEFNCPNCEALIAFDSKHTGKRARCTTCGQVLTIPAKSFETSQKVAAKIEKSEPEPGFYRAVFIDSWKLFIDAENITPLAFVAAVVCFKFFLAEGICCVNYISFVITWGWLFGFYLNIIYQTAFGIDRLPEIYLGTSVTFLWYIIKPFLVFFFTMLAVQLPFIIALAVLRDKGLAYENIWEQHSGLNLLLQALFIVGLLFFPMAILTTAVGRSFTMLRPDYIFTAVFRAFGPYLVIAGLLVATGVIEMQTRQYEYAGLLVTAGQLTLNFAAQIIAIIAMRSIGLFYRHYNCCLSW